MQTIKSTGHCKPDFAKLPPYIQERLDQPPANKGGRHEEMLKLSAMMSGERISDEQQFAILRQRYPEKEKSDQEIWNIIKGARARDFKPAETARREPGHYRREHSKIEVVENKVYFTLSDKPAAEEIPPGVPICRPLDFLKLAFKPGELVCINNETAERNGKETIVGHGHFRTIDEWEAKFEEWGHDMFDGSAGCWVRINPFKDGAIEGDDKSVADFRNLLVEFDGREKPEQWRIYKESGLPIRFVIDSGGDSLHAWIAVNAKTAEEFKARQERVYEYLEAYLDDKGNKNPSRFSRLPEVERKEKGKRQTLVATDIGAASWPEWEESVIDDGLPDSIDTADLIETEIEEPKHLLQGIMRKGQVSKLSGASKTYKSWTTMELSVAVSQGNKFLKWEANAGRVYYVDTELEQYDFRKRLRDIARAKGVSIDPGDITYLSLRGISTSLDKLVPALKKRALGYDLIVIDAIYSVLGDREENSNEDIAQIGGLLLQLAETTGAAVVFTHHFSKGSKVGIRGIEKSSGAGAWGRFPDCSIAIDQHSEDGCFNVEVDTRTFAPIKPFVARRTGYIWAVENGLKVEHKSNAKKAADLNDVLQVLDGQNISPGEWQTQVCQTLNIKPRTFQDRKTEAIKRGLIVQAGKGKATTCKLADGVARNPDNGQYEAAKFNFSFKRTSQGCEDDCEDGKEITV